MKILRRMLVGLAALGIAACGTVPYDARPPKVSVAEVNFKSLGIFEQRFDVGLRVRNPNDFDLKIEAIEFDLEVNDRPFAHGLSRTSTLVTATSSTVVRVEAVTQSRDLVHQLRTLPGDMLRQGVPYRIKGRVKTDRASRWIPFEHAGVYGRDAPRPPPESDTPGQAV